MVLSTWATAGCFRFKDRQVRGFDGCRTKDGLLDVGCQRRKACLRNCCVLHVGSGKVLAGDADPHRVHRHVLDGHYTFLAHRNTFVDDTFDARVGHGHVRAADVDRIALDIVEVGTCDLTFHEVAVEGIRERVEEFSNR